MLRPSHIGAGVILAMALALPFPAWALDWVSNGSSVNVPTGQTLETSGTGSIVSTSVSGSAADGSRLIDIEQNTDGNEPGDPTGDNSRLYCEKDFHASGVDACLLHHGGDDNNGDRLLTEDIDEGTLLSQLASSPGDPPGTAYTALYAKNDDNLYVHPEGGSEEQVCTSADISGCTASSGGAAYIVANSYLGCGAHGTAYLGLACDDTRTDVEIEVQVAGTLTYCKFHYAGTDSSCDITWTVMDGSGTTGCECSTNDEGSCSDTASHAYSAGDTISIRMVESNCASNINVGGVVVLE
tara:strand:- start:11304 stop:12194 length:891 start_codon:yes stop_codon:yes gene_type:complete